MKNKNKFCAPFLFAALFCGILWNVKPVHAQEKPFIVAELFTSHNCPSCPPADEILKTLAVQDNLITLACHVSYQNTARNPDPYTQDFCDTRQHGYAGQSGVRKIYTPQMVINGGAGFIGSRRAELNDAMKAAYENPLKTITINFQNDAFRFQTSELRQSPDTSYNLWAFFYKKSEGTPATALINLGKWDGAQISQMITKPQADSDAIAVIIQENGYGKIVAAGKMEF